MEANGVDEFGREHFVVEAAPGRLCMTLGETEAGAVVVRGHKDLTPDVLAAWSDADRTRMLLLRDVVRVGDRLVAIEDDDDVVHCSLQDISVRLGKLAAKMRRLTFARYHASPFACERLDVEKLVLVHAPAGPLGLLISDAYPHGGVVDGFQLLLDGTAASELARDPRIHRGCRILHVNGQDVSSYSRERVIETLAALRDVEKELVLYRMAPSTCTKLVCVEQRAVEQSVVVFDESEHSKCVVAAAPTLSSNKSVDAAAGTDTTTSALLLCGDVLVSVNDVDVSWMKRQNALTVLSAAAFPRMLHCYRRAATSDPECHVLHIASGPLGLHLDSARPDGALIAGFKSSATEQQAPPPAFAHCAAFLPGSRIVAINKLCVLTHSLAAITQLLLKLTNARKDILVANDALVRVLQRQQQQQQSTLVTVCVAKGPLGVHFDSAWPFEARIAGFYTIATTDNDSQSTTPQPGPIEQSGRVAVGALLASINGMNVSCLTLAQVTDILSKLRDASKTLAFRSPDAAARDASSKNIDVRVPRGPLGIALKSNIANRVVVECMTTRTNDAALCGPTCIADHGGVVLGSQVLSIDGFSVATLALADVTQLLQQLVECDKTITFSTTAAAYAAMLARPGLVRVTVTHARIGITFDANETHRAIVSAVDAPAAGESEQRIKHVVSIGSRLVAIDAIDVRAIDVAQIARVLSDLAHVAKTLVFEPPAYDAVRALELGACAPLPLASSPTTLTAAPPAPQLASLSIKPLEVLQSSALADVPTKPSDDKSQQPTPSLVLHRTEYMINMTSWTGSRSLFRLTVDTSSASLQIVSAKLSASSPRTAGSGKSSGTTVRFNDITSLDFGKKAENSTNNGGVRVAISVAKSKKPIEFNVQSPNERNELCALLTTLVPTMKQE